MTGSSTRKQQIELEPITSSLGFPERPLALEDGTIFVFDIRGGAKRQIVAGQSSVFADLGDGPSSLALGPDGWLYVA